MTSSPDPLAPLDHAAAATEPTSLGLARPTAFDRASGLARRFVMEAVLLVLCAVFTWQAEGFLTVDNLLNVLRDNSFRGIIALGMTMVIIAGEIDLSVGSAVAFSGCLCAYLTRRLTGGDQPLSAGAGITLAILAPLIIGPIIGAITGLLRVRFRVPTFITTLAWMTILTGFAQLLTDGTPLAPFPEWYIVLGGGYLFGVPVPALIFVFAFAVVQFIMSYTTFGRSVYAVGGNAEAARLSGINVSLVKIAVMAFVAFLAAVSGILQSSQIMSGNAATGPGWELEVISAVIIGGTSLMGGAGSIWGTLLGVIFLGVLVNGMTLLNVDEYWKNVVRGGLILAAVLINVSPAKRR